MQNNNDPEEKIRKAIAALGIAETNSYANFMKKYRNLALKFHPDKHGLKNEQLSKKTTEIFKNIGVAYTELKNRKNNWNTVISTAQRNGWPESKTGNYEKRLHPSSPRSQNRPARTASGRNSNINSNGPNNNANARPNTNTNARPNANANRPINNNNNGPRNTSYSMTGNNIIQNGNMRPPTRPNANANANARPNASSARPNASSARPNASSARPNANSRSPPPKRNTTYATRRIIQNDLRTPKKPSFFSRLFARFFGGAPKIDPRMFGRPIVDGMFWEHRTDETRMIKIVLTKKEAMKEIQFFARASPSVVAKVHDLFRYGDMHAIVMERVDVQTKRPVTCEDAARIRKIARSLHSAGIAHYCLDGYHLGRKRDGSGELVVVGFEHAEMFDKPVTPEMHDRVMRRDRKPLSDFNVPDLLSSFSC
jgi:hypothetical protein